MRFLGTMYPRVPTLSEHPTPRTRDEIIRRLREISEASTYGIREQPLTKWLQKGSGELA
jgi:hypothetical protein